MTTRRCSTVLAAAVAAATSIAGLGAAQAQEAPTDVNVVNVVDANINGVVSVLVVNMEQPFIATIDDVPLANALITDVIFSNLVSNDDDRIFIDFVSVDGAAAPLQRMWASFLPCTEKDNWGRVAVPLNFNGPIYNGASRVNDAYSGNVAMANYIDKGCTAVVRVFRSPTNGLGHVHVTLQGHRGKRPVPRAGGQ